MKIEEAIFYLKNTPVIASNADKETVQKAYDMAVDALNESERKKGKWIWDNKMPFERCRCSECGYYRQLKCPEPDNFCPHCGADMRGE